jgi:hypothetical protein
MSLGHYFLGNESPGTLATRIVGPEKGTLIIIISNVAAYSVYNTGPAKIPWGTE